MLIIINKTIIWTTLIIKSLKISKHMSFIINTNYPEKYCLKCIRFNLLLKLEVITMYY